MYLIKTAREKEGWDPFLEVCSTWTFCLGLVSVKVLGVQRGKGRLCHFVNLLGPWTRPGFSGHLALGVGALHPEATAGEQSGVAGILEVVRCHSFAVT